MEDEKKKKKKKKRESAKRGAEEIGRDSLRLRATTSFEKQMNLSVG